MTCRYCTPDKHGRQKALGFESYPLRERHGGPCLNRFKENILRINRNRQNKRKYFLGFHSTDKTDKGTLIRNNGFKFKKEINFCPMCGRDLKAVKI